MTTVKFIGLFVLIYTNNVGYQILMPRFEMVPPHPSIIAYAKADRIGGDWPGAAPLTDVEGWEYVPVNLEYITMSGAEDGVPNKVEPPHLTCCCSAMTAGIQQAYTDPNLPIGGTRAAQIAVTRGTAMLVPDIGGRLDTNVTMTAPSGITITGTLPQDSMKNLVFTPGATIIFGNTPLCVFSNKCEGMPEGDFRMYYTMASTANTCAGVPSDCPLCKDTKTPCPVSNCPNGLTKSGAMQTMKRRAATTAAVQPASLTITIDCSNTQWP